MFIDTFTTRLQMDDIAKNSTPFDTLYISSYYKTTCVHVVTFNGILMHSFFDTALCVTNLMNSHLEKWNCGFL